MASLDSLAEGKALAATELPAFNQLNLGGVKDQVEQTLRLIGTNGLFAEYSLHDITHVNKMLDLLETLLPASARLPMSPADWLLVVLSIYFHDMGLLVTRAEFDARGDSGFQGYCDERFADGRDGAEYQSKVLGLGDGADRFLYQEFVRENHAGRIADWITGHADRQKGVSIDAAGEVSKVLAPLPREFREDLALVCRSHHLNDLDDTEKYQVAQPYGDSEAETANVQYAAIVLRTADLLHITQDRTPSTAFRLINPQNPVSQREWAKQRAVRRVRPQLGRDEDGNFAEEAAQDTLEVHAKFNDSDGFFGLTTYLRYAGEQLRQSHQWMRRAQVKLAVRHEFPWLRIDDTHVTATGFLPQRLSFTLDQGRILELLTGHTLYNDTGVVIRELVQNAIDAVRLQTLIQARSDDEGRVEVEWHGDTRELVVRDNGTGMSRDVVKANFLRAGASRYQEKEFVEKHREFSAISRFGIGVLSAFMVADAVDVLTCSPEDPEATRLTLRSVQDRYLVRLVDKTDLDVETVMPNGTEIKLRLRETAKLPDVAEALRHWIVVPRCTVTLSVNDGEPRVIGSKSCVEAVTEVLTDAGIEIYDEDEGGEVPNGAVRVVGRVAGGVELAFATRWNEFFREWSLLQARSVPNEAVLPTTGACIEGIRVEQASAGFREMSVVGLCNAWGHSAPKTNVARSGLEATGERIAMMRQVYDGYIGHIADELTALTRRGFSSTWAAHEANLLLRPLFMSSRDAGSAPMEPGALAEAVATKPVALVEDANGRRLTSAGILRKEKRVWTIDSAFVRAGESLLREIPNDASLAAVAAALSSEAVSLPAGITLVGYGMAPLVYGPVVAGREVGQVVIRRDQRRIDMGWDLAENRSRWLELAARPSRDPMTVGSRDIRKLLVAIENPVIEGRQGEVAVRAHGHMVIFADTPIAAYVGSVWPGLPDGPPSAAARTLIIEGIEGYLMRWRPPEDVREYLETIGLRRRSGTSVARSDMEQVAELVDMDEFAQALEQTSLRVFDPSAWRRGEGEAFDS